MNGDPRPVIDVEALYAYARELTTTDLLPRLKALIPAKSTVLESRVGSHGKAQAAPLPWNDPAAMLYYEIHSEARHYESLLTARLFGHPKHRPGTDTHTTAAINRLPVLIAHGLDKGLDHNDLIDTTRALKTWPKQIRALLDEPRNGEERWANAPGRLTCPDCKKPLQVQPGGTAAYNITIVCRRCKDDDGTHRQWESAQWLGMLNEQGLTDPDELATPIRLKRLFPHVRRNTIDVWAYRAVEAPHLAPFPARGTNKNGLPLFRVGDVERHLTE
jgi:hypothetical protein